MAKKNSIETGLKLRNCRIKLELSQQQVADALGVNRTTYTYYECGRSEPNLKTMVKLAQIYGVDVAHLLPVGTSDSELLDTKLTTATPMFSLTNDEKNLLIAFRLLDDKEKSEILDIITNKQRKAE